MNNGENNLTEGRRVFIEDGWSFIRGTKTSVKPQVIKQTSKPVPKAIRIGGAQGKKNQ